MLKSDSMKYSPQNLIFSRLNQKFPILINRETERLSLWELYEGNLEEGLLYWGPRRICSVRLRKRASVSVRAPLLGNMRDAPFLGPSSQE